MKKKFNKGFTLIELLVVVAIIGTLTAIVLIGVNNARVAGRNTAIASGMNQLMSQMETVLQQSGGKYPDVVATGITTVGYNTNAALTATSGDDVTARSNALTRELGSTSTPNATELGPIIAKIKSQNTPVGTITYHYNNTGLPSYRVLVNLPGSTNGSANAKYYCIDSNGFSGEITLSTAQQSISATGANANSLSNNRSLHIADGNKLNANFKSGGHNNAVNRYTQERNNTTQNGNGTRCK